MEHDFTINLQNELKDFQTTLMLSAENMITKKMKALTIAMQQSFQDRVAQAMEQALQKNNVMKLMPIIQPYYTSQTSNTTNDHAQVYNINGTNNTTIISPNNLKRKNSNGIRTTLQIILISMSQCLNKKNTNSNLKYSLRLSPQTACHRLRLFRATANHEAGQGTQTT